MTGLQVFPIVGLPEFKPGDDLAGILAARDEPVSYTHLTLPTICSV